MCDSPALSTSCEDEPCNYSLDDLMQSGIEQSTVNSVDVEAVIEE